MPFESSSRSKRTEHCDPSRASGSVGVGHEALSMALLIVAVVLMSKLLMLHEKRHLRVAFSQDNRLEGRENVADIVLLLKIQ